ncbi:GIY-YIG nuclease family protein [Candidatus Uhrbacteria bacterium]|nr:GIY-YIG nuclease family protein [Candidatus Uhrbacteria bacterium]
MYYVYVLKSVTYNRLYIGSSENPERRLQEHNAGKTQSTEPFVPYVLIYCEQYLNKRDALRRERQIKDSGKMRKELKEGTYVAPSSIG